MPSIVITAYKRSQDKKEQLAKAITEDVCNIFHVKGDSVNIYFKDRIKENYFNNGVPVSRS
jgi:phenylpyruvate tautomerase PptA (4-oxalocrotonate tautomerase family)